MNWSYNTLDRPIITPIIDPIKNEIDMNWSHHTLDRPIIITIVIIDLIKSETDLTTDWIDSIKTEANSRETRGLIFYG
jgi:hypothetical protein